MAHRKTLRTATANHVSKDIRRQFPEWRLSVPTRKTAEGCSRLRLRLHRTTRPRPSERVSDSRSRQRRCIPSRRRRMHRSPSRKRFAKGSRRWQLRWFPRRLPEFAGCSLKGSSTNRATMLRTDPLRLEKAESEALQKRMLPQEGKSAVGLFSSFDQLPVVIPQK